MRVPWLKLNTTEQNQLLIINASHVAMIGEYYNQVTKMGADGKNHLQAEIVPDKANILINGQFISVQGSPALIQLLVSKALTEEPVTGSSNLVEMKKGEANGI